jgi:phage-related minor tail protein
MEIFRLFGSVFLQDTEAQKGLDELDKKGKTVGGRLGELATSAGKVALSLGAMGAAAVAGMVVKGVASADELRKALNGLQASTGAADEEMSGMHDAMLDIYNKGFGESFEDIGKAMSTIGQQSGESGQKLADLTKDAITLRDTFDFEVNESFRSAKMLMDQFGVSGDDAYNLIAQGAQKGLDKNGDLLDTINEYSVHFKQLGFNSEEMFNSLVNGSASGTFSVDKLGDAVKEFGIRAKDSSKGTIEAFTTLGLNATQVSSDFAAGGEKGRAAFELVTSKLLEMKDPLAQNQAGTALFGTMWEDLGVKGVAALTNTQGQISTTQAALDGINSVKYDTFGEALSGIGRNLETSVLIPMGEKVLPILGEFATWISDNMPTIQEAIGTALEVAFTVFDEVYKVIQDSLLPVLKGLWEWIEPNIPKIREVIQGAFEILSKNVIPAVTKVFDILTKNALPIVKQVFDNIVENVLPPVIAIFKWIFEKIVPQFAAAFEEWFPKISAIIQEWINIVRPIFDKFKAIFDFIFPYIQSVVETAINNVKNIINGILETLKGIITFISGVFSGDWEKAWNGVKSIFTGIFDTLGSVVKAPINLIIDGLNFLIRSMNKISFKTPDWVPGVGGKSFGINISEIPHLAKGGNIQDGGSVLVGENGPELLSGLKGATVTPLDKTGVTVIINNPTLFNERDADKLGNLIVRRLKSLGVT